MVAEFRFLNAKRSFSPLHGLNDLSGVGVLDDLAAELRDNYIDEGPLRAGLMDGGSGAAAPEASSDAALGSGVLMLDVIKELAEAEAFDQQASAHATFATICPRCQHLDARAEGTTERVCGFGGCDQRFFVVRCRVPAPVPGQALLPAFRPRPVAEMAAYLPDVPRGVPLRMRKPPKALRGSWEPQVRTCCERNGDWKRSHCSAFAPSCAS